MLLAALAITITLGAAPASAAPLDDAPGVAQAAPEETIALSASSSFISMVGAFVLAGGVVLAVVMVEARSRDEAEGDLIGRA